MDITHEKFISNSTWDPSLVMEDQINHDHTSLDPFWPTYAYGHNQIPCSNTPLPPTSSMLSDVMGNPQTEFTEEEEKEEELGAMKEMMFKIAAMQPVDIDPATIRKPKRRNVRISDDPQSVAARHRRERISEKFRILQRLVPGGTKMDTASMLEEAIRYVKFLKRQIRQLQSNQAQPIGLPTCPPVSNWANIGSSRSLGTSTRATTTDMVAGTIVGTSYSVGVDDRTTCINNNEVFHT